MPLMIALIVVVIVDGMAEAVEQNAAPRILGLLPTQLSHTSTTPQDKHDAEIVE